jgi:hypothetical protein
MGQHQQTMESGTALRRIVMVVLVAGLMALLMAASAMPALAKAGDGKYGGNDKGQGGGTGGDSPTNGSDKGVSKKDKDYLLLAPKALTSWSTASRGGQQGGPGLH